MMLDLVSRPTYVSLKGLVQFLPFYYLVGILLKQKCMYRMHLNFANFAFAANEQNVLTSNSSFSEIIEEGHQDLSR